MADERSEQCKGLLEYDSELAANRYEFGVLVDQLLSSHNETQASLRLRSGGYVRLLVAPVDVSSTFTTSGAVDEAWSFATSSSGSDHSAAFVLSKPKLGIKLRWLLVLRKESHLVFNENDNSLEKSDRDFDEFLLNKRSLWARFVLSFPKCKRRQLQLRKDAPRHSQMSIMIALLLTAIVLGFTVLALVVRGSRSAAQDVSNVSQGPKHQLVLTRKNVTAWVESEYAEDKWMLRFDDQTIVPAGILDEDELQYQRWFEDRYPEKKAVADAKLYLDAGFLSDPYSVQLPTDWSFHNAHCLLSIRRYWKAKETGKHVCMKDIDPDHIKHCLDKMDRYVFFPGPFGSLPEQPSTEPVMIWKTKVCY